MEKPRRGKATELVEELMSRPLSDEEVARRNPKVPELRLREDAPTLEVTASTPAAEVLAAIDREPSGALVVREPDGQPAAIVVGVDRYIELVGRELATTDPMKATLDGRLVPSDEALTLAHVEQTDPADGWTHADPRRLA